MKSLIMRIVIVLEEAVSERQIKVYCLIQWDNDGISNFDDLKLLGIQASNQIVGILLMKRYLQNWQPDQLPVSFSFDCDDLANYI